MRLRSLIGALPLQPSTYIHVWRIGRVLAHTRISRKEKVKSIFRKTACLTGYTRSGLFLFFDNNTFSTGLAVRAPRRARASPQRSAVKGLIARLGYEEAYGCAARDIRAACAIDFRMNFYYRLAASIQREQRSRYYARAEGRVRGREVGIYLRETRGELRALRRIRLYIYVGAAGMARVCTHAPKRVNNFQLLLSASTRCFIPLRADKKRFIFRPLSLDALSTRVVR